MADGVGGGATVKVKDVRSGVGLIKELLLRQLKRGVGKGRNCLQEDGILKVSPPLPPPPPP